MTTNKKGAGNGAQQSQNQKKAEAPWVQEILNRSSEQAAEMMEASLKLHEDTRGVVIKAAEDTHKSIGEATKSVQESVQKAAVKSQENHTITHEKVDKLTGLFTISLPLLFVSIAVGAIGVMMANAIMAPMGLPPAQYYAGNVVGFFLGLFVTLGLSDIIKGVLLKNPRVKAEKASPIGDGQPVSQKNHPEEVAK